ncbi:hypothetical protein HJC23_005727 [Cyclotella cryptica]|uniref:RNase H type-1 domain-containing protein n=1 Tax=Cyclotella cryptica TaxID=29204 RepID=A0ABD3QEJ6_9STRA
MTTTTLMILSYTSLLCAFSLVPFATWAFHCAPSSRLIHWNDVEPRTSRPVSDRLFAATSSGDPNGTRKSKRSRASSTSKGSTYPKRNTNRRYDDEKSKQSTKEAWSSKQPTSSNGKSSRANPNQESMYIQFSRVFQRHVVYRHIPSNNDTNWDGIGDTTITSMTTASRSTEEVMESFEFLDEAMAKYPGIPVLAPKDLPFPPPTCSIEWDSNEDVEEKTLIKTTVDGGVGGGARKRRADVEQDECESTVAGMGLTTLCELQYEYDCVERMSTTNSLDASSFQRQQGAVSSNVDELGYRYDQSRLAIQTLLKLVTTPESQINLPRHFFRLDPKRFASRGLTSDVILKNHNRLVQLLSGVLGMKQRDIDFVLSNFPQLCLYNGDEVECMIDFLVSPLPQQEFVSVVMVAEKGIGGESVDWPRLWWKGFGAGLTVSQAAASLRVMPELLAMYYEDSSKPSILYMHQQMRLYVSPALIDETNTNLGHLLEGTPPCGVIATLTRLGKLCSAVQSEACSEVARWIIFDKGCRYVDLLLLSFYVRFYSHIKSFNFGPKYVVMQKVKPSDLHRMIKTHSRLTGYDACFKIKPTLNKLQSSFDLTGSEMRKIVLRMPSLLGMGIQSIEDKVKFFLNEAGMSMEQLRTALLKQPSLIQYSLDTTLRPKARFFLHELGIPSSLLSRIITTAPALMGFSLSDNLRPKVCSLMRRCALNQFQVGVLIATSPSLLSLSQLGKMNYECKIEPTLSSLSELLEIDNPHDLGQILMAAPRLLHHSIASLDDKFILRERIDLSLEMGNDLFTSLQPSKRGRRKMMQQSPPEANYEDAVIVSFESSSLESISMICPTVSVAAKEAGLSKSAVIEAIQAGQCVDGKFFSYLKDISEPGTALKHVSYDDHEVSISLFVSGSVYPGDRLDVARGQSRTGGICLKVINDGTIDNYESIVDDVLAAASSCFGILVPNSTGNVILAVFPLINPSKNRCELFSLLGALRVVESFIKTRRTDGDSRTYDIKIFSDSNYALKLVSNRDRLLKLGGCFAYSEELLSSLNMKREYVNIDILHPLARSFSRLNGQDEPPQSRNKKVVDAKVQFLHSMDSISKQDDWVKDWPGRSGPGFVRFLKRQARAAAEWQYNRQ